MPGAGDLLAGRYRLIEQLASGGMGSVWRAWDERLHRDVAVKRLSVQRGLSPHDADLAAQRAMREARLTARLHHPHAVDVYDVVDEDGRPCLVMQFVPSTSLQQIVRERGPLPTADARRIGTQVAAALAAAHRVGIVHRDVKPGNVLVDREGTARITDFGISHAFDDVALTSTGLVTGTPAYLAPEVARGAPSTFATDVYSLGATLFMAVTGAPPFGTDANQMALLHRVASATRIPTLDGPLGPLLARMMSMDPGLRPPMVNVAPALLDTTAPHGQLSGVASSAPEPPRTGPRTVVAAPIQPPQQLAQQMPPVRPTRDTDSKMPPVLPFLPDTDTDTRSRPRRRSAAALAMLGAAAVVVLGAVLAIVLLRNGGGSSDDTAAAPTSVRPIGGGTSSSSTSAGVSSSAALVAAIRRYYATVPADLDTGWSMLTPHYRDVTGKGRKSYDKFWHSVRSVTVIDTHSLPPDQVRTRLTYHLRNGHDTTEVTVFRLKRVDDSLKIDRSTTVDSYAS